MATADRVLSILGLFTIDRLQWAVEDAAAELGWPVSTTYRYFRSLSDAGLIVPYTTGRYVLGPAIIQYDQADPAFRPADHHRPTRDAAARNVVRDTRRRHAVPAVS